MGMKVCKLVQLSKKNDKGLFDKKSEEGRIVHRKRVIVSEESVKETEDNCGTTGMLYVVNEKATAARDAEVDAENVASKTVVGSEEVKSIKPAKDTL